MRRGGALLGLLLISAGSLIGAGAGGCATTEVGRLRFANQPPVWRVGQGRPIPRPEARPYARLLYFNDAYLLRRLPRALECQPPRRALGVNALDEVPDSAWFENRIGRGEMSVEAVRRGPAQLESPVGHRPWYVLGSKVGGASVGFIIRDGRDEEYLLKFDPKQRPEMESAADVIVQRILYACGYNVPADAIVYFRAEDLRLAPEAVVKDTFGGERPMTREDLADTLKKIRVERDGRIRALASKLLPGVPLGGTAMEGTRADDPNDRIPHELRRDVRGLKPIFAWLNHSDVKQANSLDVWIPAHPEAERGHVRHYLIDFGMALGVMRYTFHLKQVGFVHSTDLKYALLTLPTFGLWRRPWETLSQPAVPAVGLYTTAGYRPELFTPSFPYYPFYEADRFDSFWGAKLLMRFTPEQLEAIVGEARYSDPRSAAYMTRVLVARQRSTARYWFSQVAPLDGFTLRLGPDGPRLCFDDLLLTDKLEDARDETRYHAAAYDFSGQPIGWNATAWPTSTGRACLGVIHLPHRHEGYLIVRIVTRRKDGALPPVHVHLAREPESGRPWIIGLRRY